MRRRDGVEKGKMEIIKREGEKKGKREIRERERKEGNERRGRDRIKNQMEGKTGKLKMEEQGSGEGIRRERIRSRRERRKEELTLITDHKATRSRIQTDLTLFTIKRFYEWE